MADGSGTVTDDLIALVEIVTPSNIVENNHRCYMGNLAYSLKTINEPKKGMKFNPIEYGYVETNSLPNDKYITLDRYTTLPYWNRHYSHPYIEGLSTFTYTKDGATHLFDMYSNIRLHIMVEDAATESGGFKLSHNTIAFTY